jgi:hypothetical protein
MPDLLDHRNQSIGHFSVLDNTYKISEIQALDLSLVADSMGGDNSSDGSINPYFA